MRIFSQLLVITLFATLFACNPSDKKTIENKVLDDTTAINNAIIDYYDKEFQKTKFTDPKAQFKIDTTEEGIEIKTISDTTVVMTRYNIIPFSASFIKGDLNGDKKDDIIIPVYSTGGGNTEWEEFFVFVSDSSKVNFLKMYSSFELGHCQSGGSHDGQFYPEKISNGILIGHSVCYGPEDGHLSPSFNYTTQYKFDNGLMFLNQTKSK